MQDCKCSLAVLQVLALKCLAVLQDYSVVLVGLWRDSNQLHREALRHVDRGRRKHRPCAASDNGGYVTYLYRHQRYQLLSNNVTSDNPQREGRSTRIRGAADTDAVANRGPTHVPPPSSRIRGGPPTRTTQRAQAAGSFPSGGTLAQASYQRYAHTGQLRCWGSEGSSRKAYGECSVSPKGGQERARDRAECHYLFTRVNREK